MVERQGVPKLNPLLKVFVSFLLIATLAACQTSGTAGRSNPYQAAGAEQRFVPVENGAALMAIVQGRTVVYTSESNSGAGIVQKFNANGTTVYGDQRRVWSVVDGEYCSSQNLSSPPETWECFDVAVNEAGTIIRWQRRPDARQLRAPAGQVDTWYGRIS